MEAQFREHRKGKLLEEGREEEHQGYIDTEASTSAFTIPIRESEGGFEGSVLWPTKRANTGGQGEMLEVTDSSREVLAKLQGEQVEEEQLEEEQLEEEQVEEELQAAFQSLLDRGNTDMKQRCPELRHSGFRSEGAA